MDTDTPQTVFHGQSIEHQVKVLKSTVSRLGVRIGARPSVVPWLVEHAVVLLIHLEVGRDGRAALEMREVRQGVTPELCDSNSARQCCRSASQSARDIQLPVE